MPTNVPAEPPPSYDFATGSSSSTAAPAPASTKSTGSSKTHLDIPNKAGGNGITLAQRRSMEDEARKLPPGWVRTFDPETHHQFFVDTTKEPPRSIWHHPYDDDEYLASLSTEDRERLEQENLQRAENPSHHDVIAAHSDDDEAHHTSAGSATTSTGTAELPPRPPGKGKAPDHRSFGRKFKDKVTGTTHEQRVEERKKMAEYEQQQYEQHVRIRQAMAEAARTGQPVHLGKDNTGRDVYVEPPYQGSAYGGSYAGGLGGGYPGQYGGGYGYNPYGTAGTYTTPNARYIRPSGPYNRPYGSGYGGSGAGLALAGGAGLGLLLGTSLLF